MAEAGRGPREYRRRRAGGELFTPRLVWFVIAAAAVLAFWDTVSGSIRHAVASCVYVALLAIELFWWPKWQARLLSNADRAAEAALRIQDPD